MTPNLTSMDYFRRNTVIRGGSKLTDDKSFDHFRRGEPNVAMGTIIGSTTRPFIDVKIGE